MTSASVLIASQTSGLQFEGVPFDYVVLSKAKNVFFFVKIYSDSAGIITVVFFQYIL